MLYSPEKDGLDIDVDEYPHEIYFFDSENAGISLIDGFAFGMKLEGTWRDITEDSFIKYSEASEAYAYPIKQVSVSEQGMIFTLTFEMEPFETEGEDYYLTTVCVDLKEEK